MHLDSPRLYFGVEKNRRAVRKTKLPLSIDVEGLPCLSNNLSVGVEYRHNDITDYPRPSWAFVSKESVGIFLGKDCGERENYGKRRQLQ